MAVTDALRAKVFARDKGICAFSGLSLWILDYGTLVSHHDWVDHVRPASRGGKDTEGNLVCASYFHNRKKSNNSSDSVYLFREGRPTRDFYWIHGELSAEQARMLARHKALTFSDWYFNRALSHLLIAVHQVWAETDQDRVRKAWSV